MNQKRYAYLIGANGPQTEHVKALKYAHRDAQRLAEALLAPPCTFTKAEWTIAESPQPTLAGLNRLIKQCEPSDLLLVHFSGHGNYEGQLFLICNGTDIDDCLSSAIKVEDIKAYLDKCKARHKVLILDCCRAGGAYTGPFKGDESIKSTLQQSLGSSCAILSACSQAKTTRELDALDDGKGAGFLSWAVTTACTSRFQEVTKGSNALSLMDIWHWMPTALEKANSLLKPGEEKLHLPILVNEMTPGHDGEIWLTEQRRASTPKFAPNDQLTRKKYLESVYKRYSSVTLPLGPTEGFSLHAVFQPLELRRDPLAAEDLDRKKRRPLLGERLEDEKNADRFQSHRHEKERADEKQRPVIAKNGEDALTKSPQRRVVILGGPGTGKTTTLKHLTGCRAKEALTDPNAPIPIFLSLADLARSQKTLQSYLVDLVEELGIERTYAETLWKAIQDGQAFVCLDSLDEVEPRHQRRQKMIEWVNAWATESGNTWVIGSRFTEYKGGSFNHGRFAEWELLPMDHQLRLELAEHLFPELQRLLQNVPEPSQSPATFVELLENHPQAAAWGENPLLFSLAAVVFLRTEDLPASRAMLYREVIDAILKTREASPVWQNILLRLLTKFALWLHQKGRVFTIDELVSFLADSQEKSWEETADLAERILRSGMMEPVARQTYGFRHLTFQEYLAAVELARQLTHQDQTVQEKAWEFAWGKRTYSRWTEVLRLMVGVLYQQPGNKGKQEAQHWLQQLVGQRSTEEGDPGDLGLALALKSLAEITAVDKRETTKTVQLEKDILFTWLEEFLQAARLQQKAKLRRLQSLAIDVFHLHRREVDEIMSLLLKNLWSSNKNIRDAACKVLQEIGPQVPIEPLLEALNDPAPAVRRAAVEVLGTQGEHVPVELLLSALRDPYDYVREAAVRALGVQGERVPIEPLFEALHDEHGDVRNAAAEVLGTQGERVPLKPLLLALHDEHWDVRRAAIEVLGTQRELVPIEPLLDTLHDKDGNVRGAAVRALGMQGERVPIEPLLEALRDEHWNVCKAAAQALCMQGDRVPIEPLLEALHDQHGNVRQSAVQVLGTQGDRVPIEPLLEALNDEDKSVRQATARALGTQGDRVPIEPLLEALHDEDESVCLTIAQSLGAQGERVSIEILLEALHDQHGNVRRAAVQTLGAQREFVPIELLIEALHDKRSNIRWAAIEALGMQGERVPIEILLEALHDQHGDVRIAAVEALGMQGERVPIEPLLDALHDDDWDVCHTAMEVLIAQGERVPIEPLLDALYDESEDICQSAAEVLRIQAERVPIEPLLDALHNERWNVRWAAVTILGGQGEHTPVEALLEALHDDDWNVRWAAVEALGMQGERVPIEPLLDALHDKHRIVRQSALDTLGVQGERVPIELLLEALHDKRWDIRQAAVRALGVQGERVRIESLLEAMHDEDEGVRRAAVEALGKQGKRVPIEVLFDTLHDEDKGVREAAAKALGTQGERVQIESLLEALHDEDWSVRNAAVEALGKQGERVPIEVLLEALHDEDGSVRETTIEALGAQGKRVPLEPFLEALGEDNYRVRRKAIEQLISRAPDALADVTNEAIAILNGQPAGPILGSIAKTSFCKLAGELKLALPPILDELTELLNWHHWQVRTNAAKALGSIRRNIPDTAIRRLHELRRQDPVRVVREAADDALAEILSLETSIEDD